VRPSWSNLACDPHVIEVHAPDFIDVPNLEDVDPSRVVISDPMQATVQVVKVNVAESPFLRRTNRY
jgi:hypothetical protein